MSSDIDLEAQGVAQAAPCAGAFFSFLPLSFLPQAQRCQCLPVKTSKIRHGQLSLRRKLKPGMQPLLPLAVVSQAEYFVLLPQCAAEATSATPSAVGLMTLPVISQHKGERHRPVCIFPRL